MMAAPEPALIVAPLVITGNGNAMLMVTARGVDAPVTFVAVMLTLNVPLFVGVPEITPVVVLKVTPGGNVPVNA